ncbi:tail fiber assembly protein [Vibrio parahaemolyticus]|uniref:tail fiber assembly protein n=1 Tax=Vibrio parahaemolyticus TaxID=670 RepID=UPI0022855B25|nr:tail fiber assembly protein [Vibrio parahaemolyticus]
MEIKINGQRIYNPDLTNPAKYGLNQADVDKIHKDIKWSEVREIRDKLISETDWTQAPDAPLSTEKKSEFATYRQALRDIPQNYTNPDDVVYPDKPAV